jgi:predicted transporter
MRHWIVGILALLIFSIMMALRPGISGITARTVMAAAAFGFAGIGLYSFARIGVARRRGEKRQE